MTDGLPTGPLAIVLPPALHRILSTVADMQIRRRCFPWAWAWAATLFLAAAPVFAGTNAGFTASVEGPVQLANPQVGDEISIAIRVANTKQVRQIRILTRYQTEFIEFVGAAAGDHPVDMQFFAENPVDDGGGFAVAGGGGAILAGASDTSGGGIVATVTFRILKEIEEGEERFLSVVLVRVAASSGDLDELAFADGTLGLKLVRRFVNRIFNADIKRRHDSVTLTWQSRFAGIDDTLRYRISGESDWQVAVNPLAPSTALRVRRAAILLLDAGIDAADGETASFASALADGSIEAPYSAGFVDSVTALDQELRRRRHLVVAAGLTSDTSYEYEIRSVTLRGEPSGLLSGTFRTRAAPDVRPVLGSDFDLQTTPTSVTSNWFTSRPADTRFKISIEDADFGEIRLNEGGSRFHIAAMAGLEPGREYGFIATSRLVGVDDLIEQGLMTEEEATTSDTGTFRTRVQRQPLRLLGPPAVVVSVESAVIGFGLNQIAQARIDYGAVPVGDPPEGELYPFAETSRGILNAHSITLSDLEPSTQYRYRITLATADGDSLTTDFSLDEQWSRDHRLTTSAAGDTLPPVIIEGPAVDTRDILAVVRFVTDVDTRATVFFGTLGGTYGTADEFEVPDQTPDGNLRLAQEHNITIGGLRRDTPYEFGIVATATNGRTASFERNVAAGKPTLVLQPRGGAGSFTTSNVPDTQFPVILTGPTVSTKTHDTAIVEWTTDEPASSEVRFGIDGVDDDFANAGESKTAHKLILANLDPGITYNYLVASTDALGNGATESGTAVFTTDPEIDLTAPTFTSAPQVVYKSDEQATIQWTTDEDATGEISFGLDDQLGFIRSLPTTEKVHAITLTNLTANTEYFFTASSTDLSNNGPTLSETLSFSTDAAADLTSPVISNVQVASEDASAILSWDTDEFADSFIDFGVISGLADLIVGDVEDVTRHQLVLTNLTPNTEYFFTVGSIDRANNPPTRSAESSFTTLASADTEAPDTPADLSATAGSRQVLLSWTANTELDLAGYSVFRRTAGETDFVEIATRLAEPAYADLGLTNDVTYEYRITAIDRADNPSVATDPLPLTPTGSAAPAAPADLAREGDDFLRPTFVFTNPSPIRDGAALTYTVQVSTEADFGNVTASESGISSGAGGADSGQTAWVITRDLTEGGTYYWRVRAIEDDLVGAFSAAQEFIAQPTALLAGDFNDDKTVDLRDFFLFAQNFSQAATGDRTVFDLSGNGTIDLSDFFLFAQNFGATAGKRWAFAEVMDEAAELSLQALGGTRAEDGRVTLRVWVDAVTDLKGFGLVLAYDSNALTFGQAEAGPGHLLNSSGGQAPLFQVPSERPGHLVLANAITAGQAVSGRGLLAEITFQTRGGAPTNDAVFDLREAYFVGDRNPERVRRVRHVTGTRLQPLTYFLGANFPNPFNPVTSIDYTLPTTAGVELTVFDILGRKVKTLVDDANHPAGFYTATWDGRDQRGRTAGNGLYFYRIRSGDFRQTGKMMLLK